MPRIWKFGRDIDTDQIVPGRYAPYMRPDEDVGTAAFIEAHPEFNQQAGPGDVIVADENFGCGSSREYAPQALRNRGIGAIVAKSFARIFYRNAINLGIPVFVAADVVEACRDGQSVQVDVQHSTLTVDGQTLALPPLPEFALQIINAGGIAAFVRETGDFPEALA
jgi:methanogen homoaconitase small subunit